MHGLRSMLFHQLTPVVGRTRREKDLRPHGQDNNSWQEEIFKLLDKVNGPMLPESRSATSSFCRFPTANTAPSALTWSFSTWRTIAAFTNRTAAWSLYISPIRAWYRWSLRPKIDRKSTRL